MAEYLVRVRVTIHVEDEPLTADAVAEQVREELARVAKGADYATTDSPDCFDMYNVVEAVSPLDAVLAGTTNLRAAAHAAGTYTDGWPDAAEWHAYVQEQAVEARPLRPSAASTSAQVATA